MATCIRCEEKVPLGSQATCHRAPDGGCHEFPPHPFKEGRLDGLCAEPDPEFGTSCGHVRNSEHDPYMPSSVFHDLTPEQLPDDAPPYPHRRFRLMLDLEGDTVGDVEGKLQDIVWQIAAGKIPSKSTFGGVGSGGHFSWTENEGQTHERYFEQSNAWRAARPALSLGVPAGEVTRRE